VIYAIVAGVILFIGVTLAYALKKVGKMGEKIDQYKKTEDARGKVDEFSGKRRKKTDLSIDAPDKLEPWL
jgi:hypothetical protein